MSQLLEDAKRAYTKAIFDSMSEDDKHFVTTVLPSRVIEIAKTGGHGEIKHFTKCPFNISRYVETKLGIMCRPHLDGFIVSGWAN